MFYTKVNAFQNALLDTSTAMANASLASKDVIFATMPSLAKNVLLLFPFPTIKRLVPLHAQMDLPPDKEDVLLAI
jgi:hypothetical protein